MTPTERRIKRILALPPEADFSDVEAILLEFGWERARQSGSHVTFVRAGKSAFVVPLLGGRKVKRTYLRHLIDVLDLETYGAQQE